MKPRVVALIPARSGSKRLPQKNIRTLRDHPLLAYSIQAAIDSGVFDSVVCATDSDEYARVAAYYGAEVPFLRDAKISGDRSPDIDWVVWVLNQLKSMGREYEIFSIIRPTSPFRQPSTIRRAWKQFIEDPRADSLRAVEKCSEHPGKMWIIQGTRMLPLMPFSIDSTPWHSSQYTCLPDVYSQNASLEFAWSRVPLEKNSIAGEAIIPFISQDKEGFDINHPEDWFMAERLIELDAELLPKISVKPYKSNH